MSPGERPVPWRSRQRSPLEAGHFYGGSEVHFFLATQIGVARQTIGCGKANDLRVVRQIGVEETTLNVRGDETNSLVVARQKKCTSGPPYIASK